VTCVPYFGFIRSAVLFRTLLALRDLLYMLSGSKGL
jgi:hypothetical protein